MRMTAVVAAIASCAIIFAHTAQADALSPVEFAFNATSPTLLEEISQETEDVKEEVANTSQDEAEPVLYKVAKGDTLTSIAKQYDTKWDRLFYKNVDIENPDSLTIGVDLVIPGDDEILEERTIPVRVVQTELTPKATTASSQQTANISQPRSRGSVAGNGYAYGYCTWYVKNRRPDLPNNLGNANTWAARAAPQGYGTGSAPRVGAVAQALTGYMHVAYVEAVHGNGTITVSEMNFKGFAVKSSRVVSAANFTYIY